jgi:uncharacterized protein YndB with AHSA1/START domain
MAASDACTELPFEPTRRRILQLLASRPRTVNEIAAEFTVTRSAISQHLLVLPSGLQKLQAEIDRFWTDELDLLVADAHQLRRETLSFTKTAFLPVPPDDAFALITQPERLRRWQTVSAVVDLRAGGEYRWTITPGHVAAGTYREVEPGRRVVFGWGWEGNDDLKPDSSTVTVTVEPADGGSLVTLVHAGLTEEQAAMHAEGWDHYFERLEWAATTGDAGQDEWAFAPENLTPTTAADAALSVIQPILRNLTADDRPKPTPCTEFTCHDLADHLFGSLAELGAMAARRS